MNTTETIERQTEPVAPAMDAVPANPVPLAALPPPPQPAKPRRRVKAGNGTLTAAPDKPAPSPNVPAAPAAPAAQEPLLDEHDVPIPDHVNRTLARILSWKRPYESASELGFMAWLAGQITLRTDGAKPRIAAGGNLVYTVRRPDGKTSTTLFSCHTDTVAHEAKGYQKLAFDANFGHVMLDKADPNKGSCLGADDGAGVWIMLEMIAAKVPGTYLFHRGEERGFRGANAMMQSEKDFLEKFEAAIAFDRPGTTEVITHQGSMRCCSDKYGQALAAAINKVAAKGLELHTSDAGGLTDTHVYRRVIAECVNVAVGYKSQHTIDEWLDYGYLCKLRDAVCAIEWDALPIDRDPAEVDAWTRSAQGWKQRVLGDDEWSYDDWKKKQAAPVPPPPKAKPAAPVLSTVEELESQSYTDLLSWVEDNPEDVVGVLIELASDVAGLQRQVKFLKGVLTR